VAKSNAQTKTWTDANKERTRVNANRRRAANPEKYREYNARWHRENRANNKPKVRDTRLRSAYGITIEQYEQMLVTQGGHCAACLRTPDQEHHGVLHVDHDHVTGAVRGLLCHGCNTALGLMREDPTGLAAYIEKSKCQTENKSQLSSSIPEPTRLSVPSE
jgi:hypothetical protein